MQNAQKDNRNVYKICAIVFVAIFALSVIALGVQIYEREFGAYKGNGQLRDDNIVFHGVEYALKPRVESLMLIGLDKFESDITSESYNNDRQADFIVLLVFDHEAKKCSALQINRDTMTDMSILGIGGKRIDTINQQIALSHTYGDGGKISCRNSAEALSNLLFGIRIDHYASVTMDAVSIYNDLVGGVELEVLDDFSSVDSDLVKGKTVKLSGSQALTYVRARQGMEEPTNTSRMVRQRQYLNALFEQSKKVSANDKEFLVKAFLQISDYLVRDMTEQRMLELAGNLSEYEFTGIQQIEGESKAGEKFMEFYPDQEKLKKMIIDIFYTRKRG